MGTRRIPTLQEFRLETRHSKRMILEASFLHSIYRKARRPQRSWKEHRKTEYLPFKREAIK